MYVPPTAFIFALKILAGREKDIADCRILLPQTHIRTRRQAQRALNRYILSDAQQDEAATIEYSLNVLFGSENDAENDSNHGTRLPTHLCWRRPLDGPWELYQRMV